MTLDNTIVRLYTYQEGGNALNLFRSGCCRPHLGCWLAANKQHALCACWCRPTGRLHRSTIRPHAACLKLLMHVCCLPLSPISPGDRGKHCHGTPALSRWHHKACRSASVQLRNGVSVYYLVQATGPPVAVPLCTHDSCVVATRDISHTLWPWGKHSVAHCHMLGQFGHFLSMVGV